MLSPNDRLKTERRQTIASGVVVKLRQNMDQDRP